MQGNNKTRMVYQFFSIFVLIFLFEIAPVFSADNNNWQIKVEPGFGMRFGKIGEYVYEKTSGDNILLSELDWNILPLWTYGLSTSVQYKKFVTNLYINSAFSSKTGPMADTDYMNLNNEITNFSSHDITVNHFIDAGGFLGFEFFVLPRLQLTPFVGFSFQNIKMTASDGYRQYLSENSSYKEWSADMPKIQMSGDLITYEQELYLPWLGLQIGFNSYLFNAVPVTIELSAQASPYIWAFGFDQHLLRNLEFFDEMKGGYALAFDCRAYFNFTKKDAVFFGGGYSYLPVLLGEPAVRYAGTDTFYVYSSALGGTSWNTANISLGYRRLLF